jgi:GxGYxY sequence motif in domain of unknown function N-terminal/GxGYxYP putative glycoside hydrolase C-terminal domain
MELIYTRIRHLLPVAWVLFVMLTLFHVSARADQLPNDITSEAQLSPAALKLSYSRVAVYEATSAPMKHSVGRVVMDPDAHSHGGVCLEALPKIDHAAQNTLVYGPYQTLPVGDYAAFVRLKLLSDPVEEPAAFVLATARYGHDQLSLHEVTGLDLVRNRFVQIPVFFHNTQPDQPVEVPVLWHGTVGLRADTVTLYKIETPGVNLEMLAPRVLPAKATGKPTNISPVIEKRLSSEILPRSQAPASDLDVVDVRSLPEDERLAILCLQGIVNRTRPKIYCITIDQDLFWLKRMQDRRWIKASHTLSGFSALYARYSHVIKGAVVADPALPATRNLATMLASVDDLIVCSKRLQQLTHLPTKYDLTGRWKTSEQVYSWAFQNLWPRLNHQVIACSHPNQLYLRDYLIANRIFIFWISGPIDGARPYANPDKEYALMENILAKMPVNIPVLSYPYAGKDIGVGEGPGVTLFAEFGKYLVGTTDTANLTVHSGIKIDRFKQKPSPPAPVLDRTKKYITFLISDGDNIPVLTGFNFPDLWKDPLRGKWPTAWTISPAAAMLVPDVVDYYYSTSTSNDAWIAAVSGIGYTYPDSYGVRFREPSKSSIYNGFLAQTAEYMNRMDQHILWPMNVTGWNAFDRYATRIPGLEGLFPDYGRRAATYSDAVTSVSGNVPVFSAVTTWQENVTDEEAVKLMVNEIRHMSPKNGPAFLHIFVWNWGARLSVLQAVQRELGPDYVPVRPDHLVKLHRDYLQQEKVIVKVPQITTVLEEQNLTLPITVQNVTAKAVPATVTVEGMATKENIRSLTLQPALETVIKVAGTPSGSSLQGSVSAAGKRVRFAAPVRIIAASEQVGSPDPGAKLAYLETFKAADLSKRSGTEAEDTASISGKVWRSSPGKDPAGYVIYGPYKQLPAGKYVAIFRLKRGMGQGDICTIDTCVGGGVTLNAARRIGEQELPDDSYRSFILSFNHPGGPLETRINWDGKCSLSVDAIVLFRQSAVTK